MRETTRTVGLALASGITDVQYRTIADSQGRILEASNPLYTTNYEYDPDGHVTQAIRIGGGGTQIRTFTWDGRGFLTAESLPEIGSFSGNGSTSYTRDALGNIRTASDGLHTLAIDYL